jgi:Periplasmic copper-binding protein (NosD)
MYTPTPIRSILSALLVIGFSATVFGQTRTWVSGVGDDVNPCSRTAPCKTFAGAISKTAAGGEISALDPGGFGALTVTKSITVNGTGTLASILAAGTNGLNVNDSATATPGTIIVIIRDVSINGAGTGFDGIRFTSGKSLMVDHCWIYGFNGNGASSDAIEVALTGVGNLKVINSVIENITGDGIHLNSTGGQVNAMVSNTEIMSCASDGIEASSNVRCAVSNSRIFLDGNGIRTTGANSLFNLDDLFISQVNVALQASSTSAIRISDSIIAQNSTGISLNGGTIESFQGNSLIGNTTPGAFSATTQKQ